MTDPETHVVAAFQGPVTCRRDGVSAGVTLVGAPADSPGETLILTIIATVPRDLPGTLPAARVVALDGQRCRIESSPREWLLSVRAIYAHRDVGTAFYRAIPPRPVPLKKRLFWRLVLLLAGGRLGRRMLRALRGS